MALFAYLEDAGHPLLAASVPTVKDGEKEDIRSQSPAQYLVYDIHLFLDGERVFDISKHGPESRARSKHYSDVVLPARLSDPLTNACYVR